MPKNFLFYTYKYMVKTDRFPFPAVLFEYIGQLLVKEAGNFPE